MISALFEQRLYEALNTALMGQCALVIVPYRCYIQSALSWLVRQVPQERSYQVRMPGNELHFEGTRGSVRLYPLDHPTYDAKQKRLLDYPAGTAVFLHPDVEV